MKYTKNKDIDLSPINGSTSSLANQQKFTPNREALMHSQNSNIETQQKRGKSVSPSPTIRKYEQFRALSKNSQSAIKTSQDISELNKMIGYSKNQIQNLENQLENLPNRSQLSQISLQQSELQKSSLTSNKDIIMAQNEAKDKYKSELVVQNNNKLNQRVKQLDNECQAQSKIMREQQINIEKGEQQIAHKDIVLQQKNQEIQQLKSISNNIRQSQQSKENKMQDIYGDDNTKQIAELLNENTILREKIKRMQQGGDITGLHYEVQSEQAFLKKKNNKLQEQVNQLTISNEKLVKENSDYKTACKSAKNELQFSSQNEDTILELNKLKSDNLKLKKQLLEAQNLLNQQELIITDLVQQEQAGQLQKSVRQFGEEDLQSARQFNQQIDLLTKQVKEYEKLMRQQEKMIDQISNEKKELQKTNKKIIEEYGFLQQSQQQKSYFDVHSGVKVNRRLELDDLSDQHMNNQLVGAENPSPSFRYSDMQELKSLENKIKELDSQIQTLTLENRKLKKYEVQHNEYQNKVEHLQEELDKRKIQSDQEEDNKLSHLIEGLEFENQKLQEVIEKIEQEKKELKDLLKVKQKKEKSHDVYTLQVVKDINEKDQEIQELQEQFKQCKKQLKDKELEALEYLDKLTNQEYIAKEINLMRQQNKEYKKQLEQSGDLLNSVTKTAETLESEVKQLQKEKIKLRQELDSKEQNIKTIQSKLQKQSKQQQYDSDYLQLQQQEMESGYQVLEKKNEYLIQKNSKLSQKYEDLKQKLKIDEQDFIDSTRMLQQEQKKNYSNRENNYYKSATMQSENSEKNSQSKLPVDTQQTPQQGFSKSTNPTPRIRSQSQAGTTVKSSSNKNNQQQDQQQQQQPFMHPSGQMMGYPPQYNPQMHQSQMYYPYPVPMMYPQQQMHQSYQQQQNYPYQYFYPPPMMYSSHNNNDMSPNMRSQNNVHKIDSGASPKPLSHSLYPQTTQQVSQFQQLQQYQSFSPNQNNTSRSPSPFQNSKTQNDAIFSNSYKHTNKTAHEQLKSDIQQIRQSSTSPTSKQIDIQTRHALRSKSPNRNNNKGYNKQDYHQVNTFGGISSCCSK